MQGMLGMIANWVEGSKQEDHSDGGADNAERGLAAMRDESNDNETAFSSSPLTENSRETMEVSAMLRGRSPWVTSGSGDHETVRLQRDRSISFASERSFDEDNDQSPLIPSNQHAHGLPGGYMPQIDSASELEDESMIANVAMGDIDDQDMPQMSTMRQSIFNSVNLLMGVGLLSYPYILKLSGWIGLGVIVLMACICNYTGRMIGTLMEYRPSTKLREGPGAYTVVGFHDLGTLAFGRIGAAFVSVIFFAETFGYGCIYLIIEGDNLHKLLGKFEIFEAWHMQDFVLLSGVIFLPILWLRNLSILSYFSALGALSAGMLFLGVVYAGFDVSPANPKYCKLSDGCTGNILEPSLTTVAKWDNLTAVVGLGMVGFSGHAVFPTIRNDMVDKQNWPRVLNYSYALICVIYVLIATCGYLMYGEACQEEITLNLGYSFVSQLAVWIVVINPISKFALDMAPICLGVEGIMFPLLNISEEQGWASTIVGMVVRTLLACCALGVVSVVPSFSVMMGVLGSICSFTMAVTFPCACLLKLMWSELTVLTRVMNIVLVAFGAASAISGTIAAIQTGGGV